MLPVPLHLMASAPYAVSAVVGLRAVQAERLATLFFLGRLGTRIRRRIRSRHGRPSRRWSATTPFLLDRRRFGDLLRERGRTFVRGGYVSNLYVSHQESRGRVIISVYLKTTVPSPPNGHALLMMVTSTPQ